MGGAGRKGGKLKGSLRSTRIGGGGELSGSGLGLLGSMLAMGSRFARRSRLRIAASRFGGKASTAITGSTFSSRSKSLAATSFDGSAAIAGATSAIEFSPGEMLAERPTFPELAAWAGRDNDERLCTRARPDDNGEGRDTEIVGRLLKSGVGFVGVVNSVGCFDSLGEVVAEARLTLVAGGVGSVFSSFAGGVGEDAVDFDVARDTAEDIALDSSPAGGTKGDVGFTTDDRFLVGIPEWTAET